MDAYASIFLLVVATPQDPVKNGGNAVVFLSPLRSLLRLAAPVYNSHTPYFNLRRCFSCCTRSNISCPTIAS